MSKITMTHSELMDLLCQYEQIGFQEAVRVYEPAQDEIRESDVKAWLKMLNINLKVFRTLVGQGEIKAVKKGKSKNSPWYYSKRNIKQALAHKSVAKVFAQNAIANA